ncbi:MAG: amidohydrolase family protein [Actinomycetota bacterium]
MRAIDFHVHLPTNEWIEGSLGPYRETTEAYFRRTVDLKTVEEVAREYEELDLFGVVLGWDAETFTGRPPLRNDDVVRVQREFPNRFVAFAGVDPHKADAVTELERAVTDLGMKGGKFHPSMQNFDPSDESFFPLWGKAEQLGIPCVFHTGTSGLGAGAPGGQGIRIDLSRPLLLDPVAAAFPNLIIVMAHFGWPWHAEAIAMALHKSNLYLDVSGWAPRYLPQEVRREMKGRLRDRFLWGSDYPFIDPSRCLSELSELELGDSEPLILRENARKLLRLQ